jgi:soluble lytic murein transglycosylase-like protein
MHCDGQPCDNVSGLAQPLRRLLCALPTAIVMLVSAVALCHGATYESLIDDAAQHYEVPASLLHAVMLVESEGHPRVISSCGSRGLMQLQPKTYAWVRDRHPEVGRDIMNPVNNINAGAAYLRSLLDTYTLDEALARYNGTRLGLPAAERYLARIQARL